MQHDLKQTGAVRLINQSPLHY